MVLQRPNKPSGVGRERHRSVESAKFLGLDHVDRHVHCTVHPGRDHVNRIEVPQRHQRLV